jgi:hypothetical protein
MAALDTAINETLLTNATEVQKYPLGFIYSSDASGVNPSVKRYIYVKGISVAVVLGGVYAITRSTSADWTATTPASSDVNVVYGVGICPIATGSYGFLQIEGDIDVVNVAGATTTAYAIAPTVGAATATSEGAATVSASTFAIATSTSASTVSAFIFGKNIPNAGGIISMGRYWQIYPTSTELQFNHSSDNFATIDFTNTITTVQGA